VVETIDLDAEPCSAGAARRFVADRLKDRVPEGVSDVAVLLTSELVTNVIVHARTPMRLEVDVDEDSVRVCIADDLPRQPTMRPSHEARLTGRGMNLVASLAMHWGVEPAPPGKKVWFELSA
jgi:anti-sigma regulatory factor (Ser/Thr protein kinase)